MISLLKFWENICVLIEKPEWIELHEAPDDVQIQLKKELTEVFKTRNLEEWLDLLKYEDTCVGPVYDIDQIFTDPQLIARSMFTKMQHPVSGEINQIGFPIKFSKTPGNIRHHAPLLGEHTEEILLNLHYSHKQINHLRMNGVIGENRFEQA